MKAAFLEQAAVLSKELGELKGSVMKIGQMLTIVGDHFLPPEVIHILKSLHSESPPLEWREIEKRLRQQLGERFEELEIDTEPHAAASLGQVHRARVKESGEEIVLKIQYPGVDRAIDGDLKALRRILSVAKILPADPSRLDAIFEEVRTMLHQEVDYTQEVKFTQFFSETLSSDGRYRVPKILTRYCTDRVIASSYEEGLKVDAPEVLALSQERRNKLGEAFLELYLKELFVLQKMQTDPHFGNYRIRLAEKEGEADQIILFDFGAVRVFDDEFAQCYYHLIGSLFYEDQEGVLQAGEKLGFLNRADDPELLEYWKQVLSLFVEAFCDPGAEAFHPQFMDSTGIYDWGRSDLPSRITSLTLKAKVKLAKNLRPPPPEIVFLDRKLAGMFVLLKNLGFKYSGRALMDRYLKTGRERLGTLKN